MVSRLPLGEMLIASEQLFPARVTSAAMLK